MSISAAQDLMAYEQGDLSDFESVMLFGDLVRSGLAWSLQGSYGRQAKALIDLGFLAEDGTVLVEPEDLEAYR